MSKNNSASKIKLNSVESLFGITDSSKDIDSSKESIIEVPLKDLHSFSSHPFLVKDDEKMQETVESIKEHGVLVPGIVRRRAKGGYEIISGHRRKRACEIAGLETMPVFVRDLSDDEATIVMVDSNIQREELLPSEKAKAYKMKYDAMKHQGSIGEKSGKSLSIMSEDSGESATKIQRYIYIASLKPELLNMIDEKKMGIAQGVDLSFLSVEEQEIVVEAIYDLGSIPSMMQSAELKKLSKEKGLDKETVRQLLTIKKAEKGKRAVIRSNTISKYFPKDYSEKKIEETIIALLEEWKKRQN